jgi:hypothetical protein
MNDQQIRLLAEVGFLAGGHRLSAQAEQISLALEQLRPDSEKPFLVRAMAQLNAQETDQAIRVLQEQALAKVPDSSIAKAFLGLAFHIAGRGNDKARILDEVLSADDDEDAVALARSLLEG